MPVGGSLHRFNIIYNKVKYAPKHRGDPMRVLIIYLNKLIQNGR